MHALYAVLLVFVSSAAFAQAKDLVRSCQQASEPRARVASCSAALSETRLTTIQRAAILGYRGNAFFALEMADRALADYRAAARLDPDVAIYRFNVGSALSKLGRYDEAIKAYSRAIDRNPWDAEAFNNRAWAHLKQGRPRQALADVQRALRLQNNLAEAYDTRGHIYLALNESAMALADFQTAIRLDPSMQSAIDGLRQARPAGR